MVDETSVPGAQPVVPHAGGDVGADVRVELGLFHRTIGQVVVPPTAVGELDVDQPLVGAFSWCVEAGHVECHRRLNMVPRVAVTAWKPRDHARVELQGGDRLGGLHDLVG